MAAKFQFRKVTDTVQPDLKRDGLNINFSKHILMKADKSRNIYKLYPSAYDKLVSDSISKIYNKAKSGTVTQIEMESHIIAGKLQNDRINRTPPKLAFVIPSKTTRKTFKPIPNTDSINPSSAKMRRVSKAIFNRINNTIRFRIRVIQ
ncbi:hypothetical protein HOLleu_23910 [Holothuria leucospilota]|uniref:Uncharacterized protein n=1 Tax=Holothuria leucospilota TaxID=206669 RepID=A0A9Q1BVY9_HOLLE|nr:hypothetical protein HOLleu_23910 [Holothuria leucospilota]